MDDPTSNLPQMIAVVAILIAAVIFCIKKINAVRKGGDKSNSCSGCALKDNCRINDNDSQSNCQTTDNKNNK